MKAVLLAVLVCTGGIVGGGVYFKAKETGQDPLALVKDKIGELAPGSAQATASDEKNVKPPKQPIQVAQAEEEPKPEPKSPAKTTAKGKAPEKAEPIKGEPETDGSLPGKVEPAKAETPKTDKTNPPAKADPPAKTPAKTDKKGDAGKEEYPAEQKNILGEIRGALSDRQLPFAKEKIDAAKKIDGSDAFKAEVERLATIHDHLIEFWKGVDAGGKRVHQLDEITIGSTTCSVVEYANETLVIRVDGVNKRYHLSVMSPKVALTLASHGLKVESPTNKVLVGSFLCMDKRGDKEIAKKYWEEGKKAGIDTASLMPELGVVGPKQLNVPQNLTPPMKAQLTLANWQARKEKNGKYALGPIPPVGRTSPQGWLALVTDTTQTDKMQVINRRRLAGDFTFRIILDDVKEGQMCGIFSADGKEASHFVSLPMGTAHIEMSRKGDKIECNLNGDMVEVQKSEGAEAKMAGFAGLSLPAGSNCVIAYFEFLK